MVLLGIDPLILVMIATQHDAIRQRCTEKESRNDLPLFSTNNGAPFANIKWRTDRGIDAGLFLDLTRESVKHALSRFNAPTDDIVRTSVGPIGIFHRLTNDEYLAIKCEQRLHGNELLHMRPNITLFPSSSATTVGSFASSIFSNADSVPFSMSDFL